MPSSRCFGRAAPPLFLVLLVSVAACQTRSPTPAGRSHPPEGVMSNLAEQVRQKDITAPETARELGPAAAPSLVPLTRDPDGEVREIALLCLAETGGDGAVAAMLAALNDTVPMTRSAALKGLQQQAAAGDVPALLGALTTTQDASARNFVALLVGKLGKASDIQPLRRACAEHTDGATAEGCITALAQLGDPAARDQFGRRLETAQDRELGRYLEYAERIKAAWLVPPLVSLLDNTTSVRWIGVDGLPGPETLRAADIAVNLLAEISGRQFSFAVNVGTNYSEAQRAEVRKALAR